MIRKQTPITKIIKKIGVIPLLIGVMSLSFLFRFVDTVEDGKKVFFDMGTPTVQVASAIAEEQEGDKDDAVESIDTTGQTDNVFDPAPSIPERNYLLDDPDFSSSEVEILQSLSKRREELDKKKKELDQREALLAAAEKQIENKMGELTQLRTEIEKLLGTQQEEQQARIKSLVKMYETMKSKDAARIFDTLEMDVLLSVIGQMSERKAAPILAQMNPNKARIVTIKLAEQKKLPDLPED